MRILGLDYGEKRIGVAVCDELGMTAQGLTVIERKSNKWVLSAIAHYVQTYGVEKIVIGYPLRLDGTAGIQCEKVDRYYLITLIRIVRADRFALRPNARRMLD